MSIAWENSHKKNWLQTKRYVWLILKVKCLSVYEDSETWLLQTDTANLEVITQVTRWAEDEEESVRTGQGRARSVHYGDIVFFVDGQRVLTFYNVEDPSGLVRMIKSAAKAAVALHQQSAKNDNDR
jgi:hypothetical protein